MAQWFEIKAQYPDTVLFFRMGDFFELFFADAELAAPIMEINLTHRGQHQGVPIPMCGFPAEQAASYLPKLVKKKFHVAIVEQVETALSRVKTKAKGPLKRDVVRIVTPGTLIEDELLNPTQTNLLLALYPIFSTRPTSRKTPPTLRQDTPIGAAWTDISTGSFETTSLPYKNLNDLLGRLTPAEILAPPTLTLSDSLSVSPFEPSSYSFEQARQKLSEHFNVLALESFGDFTHEEIMAAGCVVDYIKRTQAGKIPRLFTPLSQKDKTIMGIDPATRASLDILQTREGETRFTLFACVNATRTAAGARLLANWLSSPITDIEAIRARQAGWGALTTPLAAQQDLLPQLMGKLKTLPDMARALSRLSLRRGQPRDLGAIRDGLMVSRSLALLLQVHFQTTPPPPILADIALSLTQAEDLSSLLEKSLARNLPARLDEGGIIAEGYDKTLDDYRQLRDNNRQILGQLQAEYAEHYNLSSLKIRYHAQLGYVLEAPATAARHLKERPELILRQGTASLARFSTERLIALGQQIAEATEQAQAYESALFEKLVEESIYHQNLPDTIEKLALLDVLYSCASLSLKPGWTCPQMYNDTRFVLEKARHPIVEQALQKAERFAPNDCNLNAAQHVMLLTGPNMAGKSTFLRQTALAVILAQAGLPVPAQKVELGIVDRIFSRVGASDDLARGRSTFMMEMAETATILNQATERSFVVIDEIGRGTATLDGLAIAYAVLETIHNIVGCRTIFATHFHELPELAASLKQVKPFTMKVQEWKNTVVFLHEVVEGRAEKSWGIHVARLAGVPQPVVVRAQKLLAKLEKEYQIYSDDLPLLKIILPQAPNNTPEGPEERTEEGTKDVLRQQVAALDPDSLTPREALEELYHLKTLLNEL
ncbi:DNA mismatch repair protein MutS [Entomobacter blattae]|nr:DNA mismatch repair protein MutS [Entomobacter blattae]